MKSILLAIFAISLATAAFPGSLLFGQVHKRQATTEPPEATVGPTEPSNPRLVSANTCRCFKDVSNAIVGCLPDQHGEPMAFMNGMLCYCFDEEIEIPDTCVIPTGPSNVTEICSWTWWLQYFSVLALDSLNVSQFASIEGRIAAKNNIWLNNFRVNYAPSGLAEGVNETIDTDCDELDEYENSWRFSCVAGQNLSLTSGRIYSGDVIYGNVLTATGLNLSSNCQSIKNETILDFDFAKMEILRLANGLADLPATGQYSISGGVLTLTAPSQLEPNALIVWNVLLSDLLNINSLSFNGFPEADMVKALVFNLIVPSGMQIPSGFNFQLPDSWNFEELAEHGYANKIIFNFGELNATLSVSTSAPSAVRSFVGTVLAPYISLNTGSSRVRIVGQAFCHSFSGSYLIVESHPTDYCLQNILDEFQTTTFAPTATATVPARR